MMTERTGNGGHVTRAELNAELRSVRENIGNVKDDIAMIRDDVKAIRAELGVGPRWMGARVNAIVDKLLPALIAVGALWVLGEKSGW